MLKRFLKGFLIFLLSATAILVICIAPIDRTPLEEQPFYTEMMQTLDTMQFHQYPARTKLQVGWSDDILAGLLPDYSMPMAGYRPRDQFDSVHDSLYVKVMAISNGTITAYLVSVDLLLFPPALVDRINTKLTADSGGNIPFIYYSATHTHSGLGGWDPSMVGKFAMGKYHDEWIEETSNQIIMQLATAKASMKTASIGYIEEDASNFVYNRINRDSNKDGKIRGLEIIREDSSRALLVSFSGHPTLLSRNSREISGDYPSYMIKEIEKENDFGMFMAGMMGSHGLHKFNRKGFDLVEFSGEALGKIAMQSKSTDLKDSVMITTKHIPVVQGPSQLRIAKDFHVRDWIFRTAMRPLKAEITYLQIGDIILLGTSCDFSGEIFVTQNFEKLAGDNGKKLLITSFNGNYTGYITADQHYDALDKEEVRVMNWVGPYYGQYYTEIIKRIIGR